MTRRAWHRQDPELYAHTKAAVAVEYPDLSSSVRDGLIHFSGPFVIVDAAGTQWDRYEIDIRLPANFPTGIPVVTETAGRIPRIPDHHCYADGTLCLFAPGERWRYWPERQGLPEFLRGPVQSFLVGHSIYELTGQWRFGERPHGSRGIIEAYADLVGTAEPKTVIRYLAVLRRRKLAPHRACPCGSGRPLSRCHKSAVQALRRKIHWREAKQAFFTMALANHALFRGSKHLRLRRGVERGR
jgi:hypothetical protein